MNTQAADTHPLQEAVLLVKKATEKGHKHNARSLGVNIRKVKGQLQLNYPAMQRETRRASASNASSKRKFRENVGPEMNGVGNPLTDNMEKLASRPLHVPLQFGKGTGSRQWESNWLGTRQQN